MGKLDVRRRIGDVKERVGNFSARLGDVETWGDVSGRLGEMFWLTRGDVRADYDMLEGG